MSAASPHRAAPCEAGGIATKGFDVPIMTPAPATASSNAPSTAASPPARSNLQTATRRIRLVALVAAIGALAACAKPEPVPVAAPPPPPPPPQQREQVPYRPLPPNGAAYVMEIPGKNFLGRRQTINRGISTDEQVWHFRSAMNVAALNCTAPQYEPILAAYSAYIADHADELRAISERIDKEYRKDADTRREGIIAREEQMTSVYNFFALPPARTRFCRAALDIANRALAAPVEDPVEFAKDNFALLEEPFEQFFEEYEAYQDASSQWDAKWGERFGETQPGWVAAQEARARRDSIPAVGIGDPSTTLAEPGAPVQTVTDPDTGAQVPIIPLPDNVVSQPVVEPVARERLEDENAAAAPQ